MAELLFVITFVAVLFMTKISLAGILTAAFLGIVVMVLAGMLGFLFKILPWLIVFTLVIWLVRGKDKTAKRCRNYCHQKYKRYD